MKYILWFIAGLLGLVILIIFMAYLPPVQNFIKNKAVEKLSAALDADLSIGKLRLKFPLTLELDKTLMIREGDTVIWCNRLDAGIGVFPLLAGEIKARSVHIHDAVVNWADTSSGIDLRAVVDKLDIVPVNFAWRRSEIDAGELKLSAATVSLNLFDSPPVPDSLAADSAGNFKIRAARLELDSVYYRMSVEGGGFEMDARLMQGVIDNTTVDIAENRVAVDKLTLSSGSYNIYTSPATGRTAEEEVTDDSGNETWLITLDRLEINDNDFYYGLRDGVPAQGFDPSHMDFSDINIRIDSARYYGDQISARIREISLHERSGLVLLEGTASVTMDSTGIYIRGLDFETERSHLRLDAFVGSGISELSPRTPVSLDLDAELSPSDIYLFMTPAANLRQIIGAGILSAEVSAEGTLDRINLDNLDLSAPGRLRLAAEGTVISALEPASLAADVSFDASLYDTRYLLTLLPDTALRHRIGLPDNLAARGTLAFSQNNYRPDVIITADSGRLAVKGALNLNSETYNAQVSALNFPLGEFLPQDSLGGLTMELTASGSGFDPLASGTQADIDLRIDRLGYRGYLYTGVTLSVLMQNGHLLADLASDNESLDLDLHIDGNISADLYEAEVMAAVHNADLLALGFSGSALNARFYLDAEGSLTLPDSTLNIKSLLDSTVIVHAGGIERLGTTDITASADNNSVDATVDSDDMSVVFHSGVPLGQLTDRLTLAFENVGRQIDSANFNITALENDLPPLRLKIHAGNSNALHEWLSARGYSFSSLDVSAATDETEPLHAWIVATGFSTGSITLDTLNFGLRRKEDALQYFARLANRPGNIDQMALIAVYGELDGDKAVTQFYQRNRSDSVGFRFGLDATLASDGATFKITPENPTFGYERWSVNPDNYVQYLYDNTILANIRLEADSQHVYIQSEGISRFRDGTLTVDMAGIDIGNTLSLFPGMPDIEGILDLDANAAFEGGAIDIDAELDVRDLLFNQDRIGTFRAEAQVRSDSTGFDIRHAEILVNGDTALTAEGDYINTDGGSYDITLDMPGLPLRFVNAFLPDDVVSIEGTLKGDARISGTTAAPNMSGNLTFSEASATVEAIGTTFQLPSTPIDIRNSRIDFGNYAILSPAGKPLTLDGYLDLSDLSNIYVDMDIFARGFDAVNSSRQGGSMVYGSALVDIDLTAQGPMDGLSVRGNIDILNGTDVVYTPRDTNLDINEQQQDFVTFVSFADTAYLARIDTTALTARVWGMDVLVNIDIGDGVKAAMNLSDDGNNRVELIGEGSLTYTMNRQGDNRFTGRYELSGGTVVYTLPVIQPVDFAVDDGSYVEWTGEIADPSFNITARSSRRTTVTLDDNTASNVTFNIIVRIQNSLDNLSLTFDLEAPGDITIQNQLSSLTPEQRSSQALALMIYNTYTGPGTTARVDTNNPLNTLIERELNQWARNNLKGVDLSLGINNVEDASTGSQHTDYSYQVSKSLYNDRLKITVGGSINSDSAIDENVKDNFVEDVTIEYRLKNRENMFLKAYRYNTQESILEGEVVETGVGFLIRRKLNKLTDLFRFRRDPQRRQIRETRKDFRREMRQDTDTVNDPAKEQNQDDPGYSKAEKSEAELRRYAE